MSDRYDALIVGGGPAGSVFAFLMAHKARRVLVLEKDVVPSPKVCGGVLSPRCMRIFERLGLRGIVDAIPAQEVEFLEVELASGEMLHIPFPSTTARVVDRCALDAGLWRAAGGMGAELLDRAPVIQIHGLPDGWRVETGTEGKISFSGRMLAAADGRNSFVARQVGLATYRGKNRSFCVQYRLRRHEFSHRGVHFFIFDGGYCGLSVEGTGVAHLDVISLRGGESESDLRERLLDRKSVFVERLQRAEFIPGRPVTRSPIGSGRRGRVEHSNVFLLGDAQRWVEPFTGEGISLAIESAQRAAEASFQGHSRFAFPKASWSNQCVAQALIQSNLARGMIRLLNAAPRLARWMAREVLE